MTFNYFDENVSVEWIIKPEQPIKLWEQYQFAFDIIQSYINDEITFIPIDMIKHKSAMLSAYYMHNNMTFNIDQFRFTYCLKQIEETLWSQCNNIVSKYLLSANQMGFNC